MHFPHTKKQNRGFTLVELIVSVGIFSVVMVIALGSLLSVSAGERKAETLKSVMNNLNFALESMTRTIRTGTDYGCSTSGGTPTPGTDCYSSSGGSRISFKSADVGNPTYGYCLSAGNSTSACNTSTTCPTNQICAILRSISNQNSGQFAPLTAPEVVISALNFYVIGSPTGTLDNVQPKVTITLSGYVQVSATQQTKFSLQTSATERLYDQ